MTRPFRPRAGVAALGALALVALGGCGAHSGEGAKRRAAQLDRQTLAMVAPAAFGRTGSASDARGTLVSLRRLVAGMPLSRRVAQLFAVGFDGQRADVPFFAELRDRDWGAVVLSRANYVDPAQIAVLAGQAAFVARNAGHLPPLVAAPQEGGQASAFPGLPPTGQRDLGDTGKPSLARAQALASGAQLRALGLGMTLAPVADVGTPAGPLEDRVFGDDPGLVTSMVSAAVDGYRAAGVIAAAGHFPGEGAASQDPGEGTATVGLSLADLRRRDLRPFAAATRAGVPVVILSNAVYATYDGVTPAVLLPEVVSLLRDRLRFRGVVMTGDLNATTLATGGSVGAAAVRALQAGSDLLYVSGGPSERAQTYAAVLSALRRGKLSRAQVELALLRVLALKRAYGLLGGR